MGRTKMTLVLDDGLAAELRRRIQPRMRSDFICRAIRKELGALRDAELEKAYSDGAAEARRVNRTWQEAGGDGLED